MSARLLDDLKKGRRGAIAKAISAVENDPVQARAILKEIFRESGRSTTIGITGPAGAGKSSLINRTVSELQKLNTNPAVLAVDPTSHVTGGAILGDRVRMTESTDSGVYIRSIASRGAAGAVSRSVRNSTRVLEYAGFDPVIIESVGAGQTEVEISNIADITVVVFSPHTGDSIQTIKAGLTEIGDIYVVNKSDLDGAAQLFDAVRDFIGDSEKRPAVIKTSARRKTGVKELAKRLAVLIKSDSLERRAAADRRLESEFRDIILGNIRDKICTTLDSDKSYSRYLKKVQSRQIDPYDAAEKVSKRLVK